MQRLKHLIYTVFLITLTGCNRSEVMVYEPINKELNQHLLTGKNLDNHYYSPKNVLQYYQISNYESLPANLFCSRLNTFIYKTYSVNDVKQPESFTMLFYKKSLFNNYSNHVYDAAMFSEYGNLEGYNSSLVARVWLDKLKGDNDKYIRYYNSYNSANNLFERTDTVSLNQVFRP